MRPDPNPNPLYISMLLACLMLWLISLGWVGYEIGRMYNKSSSTGDSF